MPKGQMPTIVVDTWQEIWAQENAGTLNRAYLTDDECSSDPQNAQVDIYIGIFK